MDKEKNTALHEAVRFGHIEVVKLLIHEDPGLSQFANNDGETPLYMAIAREFPIVAFVIILSTHELQACGGPLDRTALHAAIVLQDNEVIEKLLERFGSLTKQADQSGWTPLHVAAAMEAWHMEEIVKQLLESDRHVAYMKDATESKYVNSAFGGINVLLYPTLENDYGKRIESLVKDDITKRKEKEKQKKEELVQVAGVHFVVVTLITTVTFVAGITLPGGEKCCF
ncbi:hypothetical protein CJ030_MR1G027488 [Morella rubra]|uniref:PGG domain-containing protein n=1 Tax=Morella rubra TaxID=262757 RepID=A0A6A1WMU4_9ROSI|nr:hypothetical protein CJ030_MR1G027488 [Morella rubra]